MAGKLTKITIVAVKTLKRGDWLNDTAVPGFKARRPNRHVLYGVSLRIAGRMRWVTIGSETEFSPDQARAEAERIRGLKRQGVDVASDRDRRKRIPTLTVAAERFLAEHVGLKLKPHTAEHYREMILRLLLPPLGDHRLDSLTPAVLADWHAKLASTPVQANRGLAIMSSLFEWARGLHIVSANPCASVHRYREMPVNRYPTARDLLAILLAVDDLDAEGAINPFFGAGIKFAILTGARRSEVFDARWEWVDSHRRCLTLPDSKTGGKSIALPDRALQLLECLPRLSGCDYIFPSNKGGPFVNFGPNWQLVVKRAAVGHWRIHDLRHGFASLAVEAGASLHLVARQLGHARPSTTNRYAHVGDDGRRYAAELVAGALKSKVLP